MEGPDRRFRAHIVAPVLAYLRERSIDTAPIVRACALPADAGERPYVDLPLPALHDFLGRCERASGDDSLGVHVAQRLSRTTWDLIQLSSLSASTLGEALERVVRLIALFNDFVHLRVAREGDEVVFEHAVHGYPDGLSRHGNEHMIVALLERARQATGAPVEPVSCWFGHARPVDTGPLREATRAGELYFGAGGSGLRLRAVDAALPLRSSDPVLLGVLDRLAEQSLAALHGRRGVAAQACRELERALESAVPPVQLIAKRLGMSTRSFQRALSEEATSYRALVDQVRRDKARALLAAGVAPEDVALRLGYSERSAFVRACARWSGTRVPQRAE